jgi:hypothetical protein
MTPSWRTTCDETRADRAKCVPIVRRMLADGDAARARTRSRTREARAPVDETCR